jgi:hypothetical protein
MGKQAPSEMPSPIRYSYRRAVMRRQHASRSFVVFSKRDARELYILQLTLDNNTLPVLSSSCWIIPPG